MDRVKARIIYDGVHERTALLGMMRQTVVGVLSFAAMTVVACFGANAQSSVALAAGNSFSSDGWTVKITTCSYASLTGGGGACSPGTSGNLPAGDVLEALTTTHGVSFEIVNTNPGTPVLSITSALNEYVADINYTLNIYPTSTPSSLTLDSVSAAVSGVGTATQYLSDISVGYNVNGSPQAFSYADGTTTGPITFAPTQLVSLSVDLKLNTGGIPGITLTVPNQTTNAPEPASLLIVGSGLLALANVRQRKVRQRENASR